MERTGSTYLILMAVLLSPMAANAVPITDTVVIGDREWAQVDLFSGLTWLEVRQACNPISPDCADDVPRGSGVPLRAQINGYDLDGWTWANFGEVREMFYTFFDTLPFGMPASFGEDNSEWAPILTTLFRPTVRWGSFYSQVVGWTSGTSGGGSLGIAAFVIDLDPPGERDAFGIIGSDRDSSVVEFNNLDTNAGVWLYRDVTSVPEPTTLALFGIGLAGMGLAKRRKKA